MHLCEPMDIGARLIVDEAELFAKVELYTRSGCCQPASAMINPRKLAETSKGFCVLRMKCPKTVVEHVIVHGVAPRCPKDFIDISRGSVEVLLTHIA